MSSYVVLLVDDSENDLLIAEIAFRKLQRPLKVIRLQTGSGAIAYLEGTGPFSDRVAYPYPDLLLLDLRMPYPDGFDVLCWIKEHQPPPLTVAALSGSPWAPDKDRAISLGACAFLTKDPGTLSQSFAALLEQHARSRSPGPNPNPLR